MSEKVEEQTVEEQTVEEQAPIMVDLKLSVPEVNQILGVMGKAPFEDVNGVIQKVHSQAVSQVG